MSEPAASGPDIHRHSGPATLVRYAVFTQSGVAPKSGYRLDLEGVRVLITRSAEDAIREGLPIAAHRPAVGLFGPAPAWSPEPAIARLAKLLRASSAVCLRIERSVDHLPLTFGWRDERVGIGFPVQEAETTLQVLTDIETQVLMALPMALPAGTSPYFRLFDRFTLAWLPDEPRPLSLVSIGAPTATVSVAYPPDQLDREAFARIADAGAHPVADLDLIRVALDQATPPMEGFVAAWAALERLLKRDYPAYLPRLHDADPTSLPQSLADVRERLSQPGGKGSLLNQFLLVRWGLSPDGLDEDEAAFRALNIRRQKVYHRGDASEVGVVREQTIEMLLKLLAMRSSRTCPTPTLTP